MKSTANKPPSKPYGLSTGSSLLKKQTQIEIEKALKEDPSVFEYDEVYDQMKEQKEKINPKVKETSNEPKYIAGIMKAAAKRQMEFEKLKERKVQKEREAEGDLWLDKEVFVTSAYKKKLEEREKLEEEERRQDQIETLLDVRKQKDLSGFYFSMLKMKTGELVVEEEGEKEKRLKEEATFKKKSAGQSQTKTYRMNQESDEEVEQEEEKEKNDSPEQVGNKMEEKDLVKNEKCEHEPVDDVKSNTDKKSSEAASESKNNFITHW